MMRKKIVSLCMALVLCLSLLPATTLAADGDTVYVGGEALTSTNSAIVYARTDDSGNVSIDGATADNYNIKWDGSTLTLCNATIKKELYASDPPLTNITGAAIGVFNQSGDANLTITLEGTNTIEGVSYGIRVYAPSIDSANLTITGSGTLYVNSNQDPIYVISSNGNAALGIKNAKVTAKSSYGNGVTVQSGNSETSSASLTVDGGSLTATADSDNVSGIRLRFGTSGTGNGTPTVTVSNNAIVRANGSAGGITSNSSTGVQYGTGSSTTGGIVFDGSAGSVYGTVELQNDLTISEGETLTIGDGASLTVPSGKTLTNNGTVTTTEGGILTNNGTINNSGTLTGTISGNQPPKITTTSLPNGEVDTTYNQTLWATGSETITWSLASGSTMPAGLTLNSDGTITGTPTTAGQFTFTATATNSAGSDSKEYELTINAPQNIPVNGVTLNPTLLSLFTGGSETLTATVEPSNATNKNVTWSSDKPEVATVENGKVTAKAAGTATITVTTEDGKKTATCTVTVTRPYIPPANPNYKITVAATQGGAVTADPTAAKAGATVTLTPAPDAGYQVGTVAVTDRFGEAVAVTEQAGGTYTFTMPNGQVTVTVTFEQAPLPFPDVTEGDWFYDAVRYAYETGLMDGVGDNLFAPNSETTRAQLVTILYRLEGEPEVSGTSGFSDVAAGIWYTDAVAWAAENGIVNGVSDTEFAPGDDITREQLAAILYRYAAYQGYDVSQRADLSGFGDASSISGYAQEALSWASAQGLVLGFEDGSLRPQGTASRAQIAAVLMRFLAAVPTA